MEKRPDGKQLYDYQQEDLNKIFTRIDECPPNSNLLYQLPTGGGKTVIFSEITRRFIENTGKQVLILTHRIELSRQTSRMLTEFNVSNMVIDSSVKELPEDETFDSYVAMVETLNNRLHEKAIDMSNVGMVIIDEAHYNSFRKLFKFFENSLILGVTATPLSSNINLPMHEIYSDLIVGYPIQYLVDHNYLSQAITYSYNVTLGTLKVGINGDYTVKSSEALYGNLYMQSKLLRAYEERAKGKKVLIFNNGIITSQRVYHMFADAGHKIRHIDSKTPKKQREEIIDWFKHTPDAILTSVGILTTGFDEPTIQTIILNRATKSPTLYYQMIGRGSRKIPGKSTFDVIDLGNNTARFGLWADPVDWYKIFRSPIAYLESIRSDDEIEKRQVYVMSDELKKRFSKTKDSSFDVYNEYKIAKEEGLRSIKVIEKSLEQHAQMCIENVDPDDLGGAWELAALLEESVNDRIRRYCYCIAESTKNYRAWLLNDYLGKLKRRVTEIFKENMPKDEEEED